MKTNKFWSILVMLVVSVTAMVFTSCSSDDDGDGGSKDINAQEVFGTWTYHNRLYGRQDDYHQRGRQVHFYIKLNW